MTHIGEPRQRRRSRPNVVKRGSTWTYYVHFADADGRRRQHSKGGFKTAREAEAARLRALHALETGAYVKPERLTLAEFLLDEWLPSRRPPALEESTWESYERNIRLHVVPFIGAVPLQKLDAPRLNWLYRQLLECGRRSTDSGRARHDPALYRRVLDLRAHGATYESIAEILRVEFPTAESISRHAVAGIFRRGAAPVEEAGLAGGLSARSVRYVHTILHAALKDALRWTRVVRNVVDAATPPSRSSVIPPSADTWSAKQLNRFLSFVSAHRLLPAWLFLATSGTRRGETLGLHWRDVDLEAATATIRWQVTAVRHEVVLKERTKAGRPHVIRLDGATVAMLRSWRARQGEERLLAGPDYDAQDLVFSRPDGGPLHPERFSREFVRYQQYFNRDHADDPLPRLKLHGLRHTWATLALEAGIDIKVVSDRLNHSSTYITQEIYSHVTPPMQTDAAERVAAAIFGQGLDEP